MHVGDEEVCCHADEDGGDGERWAGVVLVDTPEGDAEGEGQVED